MKYTPFHEQRFRASVDKALEQVKKILDNTRNPRLAEEEEHKYDDKYALVEFLTNTAVASQMNALERLGLDPEKFKLVAGWVHNEKKTVTLRFKAWDSCSFLKERDVEITTGHQEVERETTNTSSSTGFLGMTSGTSTEKVMVKVVSKLKEYHWKCEMNYSITMFAGSDPSKSVELDSRSSSTIIITSGGQARPGGGGMPSKPPPPIPDKTDHSPIDTNVTWFFRMIQPQEQICQFKIDRSNSKKAQSTCKTPRRNEDVDAAFDFNKNLLDWILITQGFFVQRVEREILAKHDPVEMSKANNPVSSPEMVELGTRGIMTGLHKEPSFNGKQVTIVEYSSSQHRFRVEPIDKTAGLPSTLLIKPQNLKIQSSPLGPPLSDVSVETLFCPVIPLMENKSVLSMAEVGDFLTEQCRSMDEAIDGLSKMYAPRQLVRLVSVAEATVILLCQHLQDLTTAYQDSVDYVENMLKSQLTQAIGKEIQSKDFDQFMVFHNQRLFGPEYAPKPFTYSIRRPGHYPDGILTIESTRPNVEPIHTWVRRISGSSAPSMFIPLNAATTIEITGDRFLHGWMQHRFKTKPKNDYQLVARARQFSSFILVIGTLMGVDTFDPKDAIILRNKDEAIIPILTSTLPSAKEFKDSIASLSPEQQAFATSFRRMQLESSVFGVCVIQLKPQLEKLLGLPNDALTKEIQLTQDLTSLFVDYQIPSDLMSFDGTADSDVSAKVAVVKGYVKSIMDVIENEKEKQLTEEERKADMRGEIAYQSGPMPVPYGGAASGPITFGSSHQAVPMMAAFSAIAESSFADQSPPSSGRKLMRHKAKSSPRALPAPPITASTGSSRSSSAKSPGSPTKRTFTPDAAVSVRSETVQPTSTKMNAAEAEAKPVGPVDGEDFTMIPKILDLCIEKFDSDNALRSVIIKTGPSWTLMRQQNLLTPIKQSTLAGETMEDEKKKAFDLLDAISRSGVLPIDCSELHVVIGVSHCFDNDVMGSVVQDNVNPIEKVERSGLLIASTVHAQPAKALIKNEQQTRLAKSFPLLLKADAPDEVYGDRY